MNELIILTDANGFTTSVSNLAGILKELGRRPMLAPIKVFRWRLGRDWVLAEQFTWTGAPF
jgi:hypothetical protein